MGEQPPSPSAERVQRASVHASAAASEHASTAGIRSGTLGRDSCSISPPCVPTLLSPFPFSTPLITWFASWLPSVLRPCVLRGVCACCILFFNALPWMVASLFYVLDIRVYRQNLAVSKMIIVYFADRRLEHSVYTPER